MMKEIKLKIRCSEIVYQLGDGAIVASGISFGKKITPENLLGLPLSAISQIKAGLEQLSKNCDANSLCNSRTQLSDFFQSEIIQDNILIIRIIKTISEKVVKKREKLID